MRIKILKPNLTILGKVREVGEIVNDEDPNECRNLVVDGRAIFLTPEEEEVEDFKQLAAEESAEQTATTEPAADSNPA